LTMPKNKPPVTGKYIDLLVDFAFKKIFGSEPNKDLLIAFLNEVFRGRKHIVDLVYNKNDHPGDIKDEGTPCLICYARVITANVFYPDSYREKCKGQNKDILRKGLCFIPHA